MTRVWDFFINREWRVLVAIVAAVLTGLTDAFGQISDTAETVAGVPIIAALPAVAALIVGLNASSRRTVADARAAARAEGRAEVTGR